MKILYVSPVPPLPIRSGIEIRLYHLIAPLCARHEVKLLCFEAPPPRDNRAQAELNSLFYQVEMVPLEESPQTGRSLLQRGRELLFPPPEFTALYSRSTPMREAALRHRESGWADVVLANGLSVVTYFPGGSVPPVVLDMFDSVSLHKARALSTQVTMRKKLSVLTDWIQARRYERMYCGQYRDLVLTSEEDARLIQSAAPGSRVWTVTNGTDLEFFASVTSTAREPVVAFLGVMDYAPNVDAVCFFAKSVMPLIWQREPAARFLVIGRRPADDVAQLAKWDGRIVVTGEVDDVRPHLSLAQVCICPMRAGAGIKNKILEAWAAAKPVVATSISLQGLKARPGENVLVADRPQDLAAYVLALFANPVLRASLAAEGRKTAVEFYPWSKKASELEAILERAVRDAATPPVPSQ